MLNNTFVFGTISAGLIQISSPNVTIDTTGLITTSGMGYTTGEGPGAGSDGQGGTHAGGSYSSCSSNAIENTKYYGNIQNPTEFGSGGGSYGNGGGAVFINSSFIVLNGIIRADGQSGNDSLSSTGGSGGSIWLTASISGNGMISANGGSATQINVSTTNSTGGGSGGRISLYSLDSIKVSASGGVSGDGCAVAAYGTVYVSSTNTLFVDGLGTAVHNSGLTWIDNFSYNIVALSYANVLMTTIQANYLSMINSAVWGASENVFFEVSQFVIGPKSQVTVSGNVTFAAQSMEVIGSISASVAIFDSKNISIFGVVNVDGGGYTSGLGPGYGFSSENSSLPAGGGSFGGYSVIPGSSNTNCSLGPVGNFTTSGFGSGGGSAGPQQGGNGGGFILFNSVFLQIDGMVSADGNDAQGYAGGGSGGSVFIFSNFTSGVGTISANGGGSNAGGLGSGGRIYVSSSSIDVQLTFSAFGSVQTTTTSKSGAGAGTVYFSESDELFIANGVQSNFTGVSVLPDKFFSSIVVTNSAVIMNVDSLNCTTLNIKYSTIQNSRDFTYTFVYAQMIDSFASVFQMQNYSIFEVNMSIYMSYSSIYGSGLSFFVNSLNLDNSEINADGKGYGPGVGPGAGQSGENNAPGGGAGYGANGMSSCGASAGGRMYGNRTSPDLFGSGGGNAGSILGGSGGGLIKMISNFFYISNSVISADGFPGNSAITTSTNNNNNNNNNNNTENLFIEANIPGFGAGGGSGGSIAIYTLNLDAENSVTISAKGGNGGLGSSAFGGQSGGGGAGGRIFISSNNTNLKNERVGTISVDGGETSCFDYSSGGSAVSQCQPGFTANPANLMQCVMCGGGYASSDGLSCLPCLSGTYSPQNNPATICTPCGTGTAAPKNGSYYCSSCTSGYFSNVTGSSRCGACPAGSTSNYFYDACDPCPMGTFSRYAGSPYCTSCSANFYQNNTGQTTCLSCSYGYGAAIGSAKCIPCGPGTYVSTYYGGCSDCQAGSYSSLPANVICNECPMGQYEPNMGSAQCLRCPPGQYQSYSGSTRCYFCPAGRYSESYGSSYCTECDAGTYNPNQGASSCMYCKNTYQGASYCYDSSSSSEGGGGGPSFLWWGVPLLLLMFIILPAVWCWRRRNLRASYQPIPDARPQMAVQPQMPVQPQILPQPYLPQIPPARDESNINNSDETEQETEAKECIICCDAKRDTVLLPCGHIASCEKCTRALLQSKPQCPICRNAILSFVRMYSV